MVHIKQLSTPLVLQKEVIILHNKTPQVMLQPKYAAPFYQTMLDFQGPTMIFIDQFDKYSPFYTILVQFETNRFALNIQNMDCNILCITAGQIIAYLNYRS